MDKLLTLYEVANILNVHYRTVLNWIKEDRLKANKLGRVWRVSEEELEKFIKSKKPNK